LTEQNSEASASPPGKRSLQRAVRACLQAELEALQAQSAQLSQEHAVMQER